MSYRSLDAFCGWGLIYCGLLFAMILASAQPEPLPRGTPVGHPPQQVDSYRPSPEAADAKITYRCSGDARCVRILQHAKATKKGARL